MLRDVVAIAVGRLVRRAVLLLRPGGGTAIPGRVVEKLAPGLLARILAQPPKGVVAITGSSGKSTTTKMVVAILDAHGLDVFTNKFTANITRGMLSELLRVVDWRGRFPHEIAVMEMDEGYAALTTEQAPARVTVLLNVMLDQLHRWQEPERVAGYLERAARATTDAVVVNRDDPLLGRIASRLPEAPGRVVHYFGVADEVQATLPHGLGSAGDFAPDPATFPPSAGDSVVTSVSGLQATLTLSDADAVEVRLPARGVHFAVDSAAALEAARAVLGDAFDPQRAADALSRIPTVFGRGEKTRVGSELVEFVLAKSPASFQLNLDALDAELEQCFIAVGRDMVDPSSLWAADWSAIGHADVVSGDQLWEIATKLAYDEVELGVLEPDLEKAAKTFFALPEPSRGVKTVVFTAQSMRWLRRHLGFHYADTVDQGAAGGAEPSA